MPDVLAQDISTATPTSSDTVLGVQGGVVKRFYKDALGPFVNVKDPAYGAVGDGVTDDTAAIQAAMTYAAANGRWVFAPAGSYRVTAQLTYTLTGTNLDYLPGITLLGEGMGKTVFINEVSDAAMLYLTSTSPYFAKGNHFSDFSIVRGASATGQAGIRSKGAWYTSFDRIRIRGLSGTAVLVGEDLATNPDTTANCFVTFRDCELDENIIGIKNPVNNNAPLIRVFQTSIRNNTQAGIIANSSHLVVDGGSVSFNGLADPSNARGGIVVDETSGTTFSSGYRSKDVRIVSCEIDTNYPFGVDIQTAEMATVKNCSMKWEDYSGTAAADLAAWPTAQIRIGGTTNAGRVIGAVIEGNRIGVVNNENIAAGMGGHALLHIRPYGQGVRWREQVYDIQLGSAVMGTDCLIIKEDSKSGTSSPDLSASVHHVDYDYPSLNGLASWLTASSAYSVPYPKVFPAQRANTQFQFLLDTDTAKSITVPTRTSESFANADYGFVLVSGGGTATRSELIGYRAVTGPECYKIGSASTGINVTTGALAGTTGTSGKVTVSAHTDGKIYVENRTGAAVYFNVAFLVMPGLIAQA